MHGNEDFLVEDDGYGPVAYGRREAKNVKQGSNDVCHAYLYMLTAPSSSHFQYEKLLCENSRSCIAKFLHYQTSINQIDDQPSF